MKSNYKRLGDYIQLVDERNSGLEISNLVGLTINKEFIPSVANTIGSNMANYKIIRKNRFACSLMQVRRDKKIPMALFREEEPAIISQAYPVFEIIDTHVLLPEYLMMWFSRAEFDRQACFYAVGGVRGSLEWSDFCDFTLPIPDITQQQALVDEYQTIERRIKLNEQLCQKLEETAQALYLKYFVEDIDTEDLPEGWRWGKLGEVANLRYGKMLSSEKFLEKGFPVFSGYGIRGYYSEYMYEEPQILVLCRGVSGTGEVRMSPKFSYITNLSIVVEVEEYVISKMYLFYYLKDANLETLDSGSAQSMITTSDLYEQDLILPPLILQRKFSCQVDKITNDIDIIKTENQKLKELLSLLLVKMGRKEEK